MKTFLKKWLSGASVNRILLLILIVVLLLGAIFVSAFARDSGIRRFIRWQLADEEARQEFVTVQRDACPGAPFILPADGMIGLLYGDNRGPYSNSSPHQGIDIFSGSDPGLTPVYAAYDGFVTREKDWRSTVIQRVPDDPLVPGRQIWLYYTHMANRQGDEDFIIDSIPAGTHELFVEQGTLLGYTGNYSGNAFRSVWVHLHFSIVKDDGTGRYLNELEFENSLDPSPYLGLNVNIRCQRDAANCNSELTC